VTDAEEVFTVPARPLSPGGSGFLRNRNRIELVARLDRRTVLRRGQVGEALLDPGDRVRQPGQEAPDVAERVVLLVVDRGALRAVAAGERADVASDHHAVAGAPAVAPRIAPCPSPVTRHRKENP